MKNARATARFPFCAEDARYNGTVEVVEVQQSDETKTVGLRLLVGGRSVPLPRNRVSEVIAALQAAETEASNQYQQIIEEMNHHER